MMWKEAIPTLVIFGVVSCLDGVHGSRIPSFAGPYRIRIERITNETDEFKSRGNSYIKAFSSHPKGREAQHLWGHASIHFAIDDQMRSEGRIAVWSNNQWKKNAFVLKFEHSCSSLLRNALTMVRFIWLPHEIHCPLPAYGERNLANRSHEFEFPNIPVFPYGRYRFSLATLSTSNEVLSVVVAIYNIEPKI